MEYTLVHAGRSYDLPKFTKSVKNDIDKINADNESKGLSDDEKYKRMYVFVKKMIGEENSLDIFETDNLDEIDLQEITICFLGICNGYDKPVLEARREASTSAISSEDRNLVIKILENAGNIQNLEKFMKQSGNASKSPLRTV